LEADREGSSFASTSKGVSFRSSAEPVFDGEPPDWGELIDIVADEAGRWCRAVPAISVSSGPIGVPARSSRRCTRAYHTRRGVTLVILLAGGDKSTQARDIARAVGLAAQLKDPR
jgi:hypothetical protein